ncbi:MAG: ubiquitin-like small modifier protein 1 [Candidatus Methanoperedens sp.]|nr:MoaD/ThiS family protein [Candidatus Methanoperedens sp.]
MVLKKTGKDMPTIKVKLFANFREFTKTKELKMQGGTVRDVLVKLCNEYPGLEDMLFKNENLRPHVNVFLNGRDIPGLDTPLKQDDEMAIFPPVSGG